MNNISVAKETLKIIKDKSYTLNGRRVDLQNFDFSDVQLYSPECENEMLLSCRLPENRKVFCISICAEDSFQAASRYSNPMVMNFANAHKPGGWFELGATAQEESLCRCSTLIASLKSESAKVMYRYNNTHLSDVETDYMLYKFSDSVSGKELQILEKTKECINDKWRSEAKGGNLSAEEKKYI